MSEHEGVSILETVGEQPRPALRWPCLVVTLALMIGGLALLWRKPLWLHPPLSNTLLIYAALAWVWLPAAIFCLFRQPRPLWRKGVLSLVLSLLVGSFIFCSVLSSGVNLWMFAPDMAPCERTDLPDNRVRFQCTLSIVTYYEVYEFEGPADGPFLRLIEKRTGGS